MTQSTNAELLANLEELARREREERCRYYKPYSKQKAFHAAGADHRERLFCAANQVGKTLAGSMELGFHLTGEYPSWWKGRRFDRPVRVWAAGVTAESTRDNPQRALLGAAAAIGTGAIPKRCIHQVRNHRGMADAIDHVYIKHRSGGLSCLMFKSYERGREKWQGDTLDVLWLDEEPPPDIYSEALARTIATGGFCFITATPLLGMSEVVQRFLYNSNPDRHLTQMSINEAKHISPKDRKKIIASYQPHERDARARGIPSLGSGRVFPIDEAQITVEPFEIPEYWRRLAGLDLGWVDATACVWVAHDVESDVLYVYDIHKLSEATPSVHAEAIKRRGAWIPCAWPFDGAQTERGSGASLASQYRALGCSMLPTHAQWSDGSRSVEGGLSVMLERMMSGRLKVLSNLEEWFREFRVYHRNNGRISKHVSDDLLDATRYAIMMLHHAAANPGNIPVKEKYTFESQKRWRRRIMRNGGRYKGRSILTL